MGFSGQVRRVDMTLGKITFQGQNNNRHKTINISDIIDIQGDFEMQMQRSVL